MPNLEGSYEIKLAPGQTLDEYLQKKQSEKIESILKETPKDRVLSEDEALDILVWANSFNRFPTFLKIKDQIKDPKVYWKILASVYQDSDNTYNYRNEIKACFASNLPHRDCLMEDEEKKHLDTLPDTITIYRGMTVEESELEDFGISWTLKKETADFFTTYWRNFDTEIEPKTVKSLDIPKDKVIAYFNGRNEEEVIYIGN